MTGAILVMIALLIYGVYSEEMEGWIVALAMGLAFIFIAVDILRLNKSLKNGSKK